MSEYRQLKRQVGDLLVGLGATPDEVASSLEASGVRGTPRSNRNCPIALYLSAVMGADLAGPVGDRRPLLDGDRAWPHPISVRPGDCWCSSRSRCAASCRRSTRSSTRATSADRTRPCGLLTFAD